MSSFITTACAVLSLVLAPLRLASAEISAVDCGGHYAETCGVCPQDNGELWCHGDCMWLHEECKASTFWNWFVHSLHHTFWTWIQLMPLILLIGLVMLAYAVVYKKKIVEEIPQEYITDKLGDYDDDLRDPEYNIFSVFTKPHQCLWAFFCTPVVAAKNYHVGGVLDYWPACCVVFWGVFSLFWPLYCIMVVVRATLSQRLSRNLKLKSSFMKDCCLTLFCFPCEVGRESLEVNDTIGVTLNCPFKIEKSLKAEVLLAEEKVSRSCDRTCGR